MSLSTAARRLAILRAVLPLFAQNGLGALSLETIAEAAKVPQDEIQQHFPRMQDLYAALSEVCGQRESRAAEILAAADPSTGILVRSVYFLMHSLVYGAPGSEEEHANVGRLLHFSLLGEGHFVRAFHRKFTAFMPQLSDSLDAARTAGDLSENAPSGLNPFWYAHHIAMMLALFSRPERPAIRYRGTPEERFEQAVSFALRGIGLSGAALRRHYRPRALQKFVQDLYEDAAAEAC